MTNQAPDKRRCKARSKKSGDRCRRYAIPGGSVCAMHGGSAPQVRAAAERRLEAAAIEAETSSALAWLGEKAIDDPLDELGRLATESRALTTALGARVNALKTITEYDLKESPSIKAEIQLYERAMDRTHRMLETLIKAGYMERQLKIAEDEASVIAGVVKRVLQQVGLSSTQQRKAGVLLQEEFKALEAAPPTIGVL